ncbi:MAG: outer membrane protein transport protein [Tannerella sp.]|jgi:long-subunit fatty acid transport protein|nr:outer membrane protein transport protein [Tannerella sp.]
MKRISLFISTLLLLSNGMLFAQGEMDAYRYSQSDLSGTARSVSMGGAFGALGGDMSVMSTNPAGLAIYRSSELQTTMSVNSTGTEATSGSTAGWAGNSSKTRFGFDNLSYTGYFPTGQEYGIKGWNFGISYHKIKDFNRSYAVAGSPKYSMADYVASRASNAFGENGGIVENDLILTDSYDPYNNRNLGGQWLSILGYESGFFGAKYEFSDVYHSAFGQRTGNTWSPYSPDRTTLRIGESGSISEYNFSIATNISDFMFIGATLGVTTIDYNMSSTHEESFGSTDYLKLGNSLETTGTGYSVNIGAIVRPIDMLRLGVAYNSPKFFRLTDYFDAYGESNIANETDPLMTGYIPEYSYAEYSMQTPGRWIFSAAGIIGTTALVSLDYELTGYNYMSLADRDGNRDMYQNDNDIIKDDFKFASTVKAGVELKVTPRFAIRAGYVWQPSPMKDQLINGDAEVFTAGTVPHYTVTKSTNYISAGLGYRFTPNFYMDIAGVYRVQKEKLYPFSNSYWTYPEYNIEPVYADPADLSVNTFRAVLSLGYKF